MDNIDISHVGDDLAKAYEQGVEDGKPKWIPVTEREPEPDKDVLIMVHLHNYLEDMMCYGRRHNTKWWIYNSELGELIKGFDITHWMPLPEPPKEET